MNKPARLLALLGGPRKVSVILGIHESGVSRWPDRGNVPAHHNVKIMEYAGRLATIARRTKTLVPAEDGQAYGSQAYIDAVNGCLDMDVCPCCLRPIEPGVELKPMAGARTVRR